MFGFSAKAFSSLRFPMKHQGQTTSETTSIVTGATGLVASSMAGLFGVGPPNVSGRSGGGNRARYNAGKQRQHGVGRLQRGERQRGTWPWALAVGLQHGVLEHGGKAAGGDV